MQRHQCAGVLCWDHSDHPCWNTRCRPVHKLPQIKPPPQASTLVTSVKLLQDRGCPNMNPYPPVQPRRRIWPDTPTQSEDLALGRAEQCVRPCFLVCMSSQTNPLSPFHLRTRGTILACSELNGSQIVASEGVRLIQGSDAVINCIGVKIPWWVVGSEKKTSKRKMGISARGV